MHCKGVTPFLMNSSERCQINLNHSVLSTSYYVNSEPDSLKPKYFGQIKTVIRKHKNKLSLV